MVAGAREQDVTDRRPVSLSGDAHGQRRCSDSATSAMPRGELLVDVLNDDDRRGKVLRQIAQERGQHRRAAGRRADRDQPIVAARLRRAIAGSARRCRPRLSPISRADRVDLGQQRRGEPPQIVRRRAAGVSTASSAPWPIASKTRPALTRTLAVTMQDRARRAGHDAARRFHAVHARHEQVHQDQVRRLLRAALHRFGAAQRDPDDAMRRLQTPPRAAGARRPPRTSLTMPILTRPARRSDRRPPGAASRRESCPWSGSTPRRPRGRAGDLRRGPCRTRSSPAPTSGSRPC